MQMRRDPAMTFPRSPSYDIREGAGVPEMSAVWKEILTLILKNKVLFYLLLSRAEHFQHKLAVLTTTKPTVFSHTWLSFVL